MDRPVGGFFAQHMPDGAAPGKSLLERWTQNCRYAAFVNARSAFAALVAQAAPRHVWLPAYMCADLLAPAWKPRARFYRVGANLEEDVAGLARDTAAGDLVLAVDYFGRPVSEAFVAFTRTRQDLMFVEDRAQALDPGGKSWASWRLYSPRKLLGVADGGILTAGGDEQSLPQCTQEPDSRRLWTAPRLRHEDHEEADNVTWYAAHREKEARMAACNECATALTIQILSATSLAPLAERRRHNWTILHEHLGPWLAFDCPAPSVPFGYVIGLPAGTRDSVLRALHASRIFAGVQWAKLASPRSDFEEEHGLAERLITLPCDHRYEETIMHRLGRRVAQLLS